MIAKSITIIFKLEIWRFVDRTASKERFVDSNVFEKGL